MAAQGGAPPSPPLIRTKLHGPIARRLVARPNLLERLRTAEPAKLTLIYAPAGWGKSSVLAAWAAAEWERRPFAWLAIDEGDNDVVRFWTYVIEALRGVEPSIGSGSLALLRAPGTDLVALVIPELINELAALSQPAVLALDDYHSIRDPEIHASVGFFVEHAPQMVHVAIATRSEPPLPLARMRGRRELIEIDAATLRFSEEEAEEFLNDLLGLGLTSAEVRKLHERTEGWAAGLYLAALSLRDRDDRRSFIGQFSGDDRHVLDYLGAEVLAGQRDEVRTFLLRTSVLERLSASLCDAVTRLGRSGQLLQEIERSNLFLVPLDPRREWYRYHHIFRDLLQHELDAVEPAVIPDLHRRAAAWLLHAGFVSEAIHHTIAAGDLEQACELIATHWTSFIAVGDDRTIARWVQALPQQAVLSDARVCVAAAVASLSLGQMDQTRAWLEAAERAIVPGPFKDGFGSVACAAAYLRSSHGLGIGDLGQARDAAREAVRLVDDASPWRHVGLGNLGISSYLLGETEEGIRALEESLQVGRVIGLELGMALSLGALARIRVDLGQWDEAEELATQALALGADSGQHEHWGYAFAYVARASARAQRGELDAAEADFSHGIELQRRAWPIFLAYQLPTYASLKFSLGDKEGARKVLREARWIVEACPDPGILPQMIEQTEGRLRLGPPQRAVPGPIFEELTDREVAVLRLLAGELSQREIGNELYVSLNTVKSHTKSIFRKLGVSTRTDAVARARDLELL